MQTPLIMALNHGNTEIAETLIEGGADVNFGQHSENYKAAGNQGIDPGSALGQAAYRGYDKIVDLCIAKGADVNRPIYNDQGTPLVAACKQGNLYIAQRLLEAKALITGPELIKALEGRHHKITNMLLKHEHVARMINHENYSQQTPLIVACNKGNQQLVQALIEKGANVFQIDAKAVNKIDTLEIRTMLLESQLAQIHEPLQKSSDLAANVIKAAAEVGGLDNKIKEAETKLRETQANLGKELRQNYVDRVSSIFTGKEVDVLDRENIRNQQKEIGKVLRRHKLTNITDQAITAVTNTFSSKKQTKERGK